MKDNTILLNWDSDCQWFFLKNLDSWDNLEEKAKAYLDTYYKDCGIGDILFDIFCQNSLVPSKVFTSRADKAHQKEENGICVDYSDCTPLSLLARSQEEFGVIPVKVWIEHCKEIGIRPWLSLRMNDNHYRDDDTNFLRSDFFYEALEKGWMLGKKYRSGHRNFNYAVPEVRQKMLAYIEEQMLAFDVYGIELDFMREPKCVPFFDRDDCCTVMTEFMAGVKAITRLSQEKWGHPAKIAVRLPRDPDLCKRIGFDTVTWAQKGLIDAVIPSGHWLCNDTGMPIDRWAQLLNPHGVEVYAGMEMNLPHNICISAETAKAHTAQYAAQGSARTYIYNLYHPYLSYLQDMSIWYQTPSIRKIQEVWAVSGDADTCRKGIRRHILTEESLGFSDIKPRWCPLPAQVGEELTLSVPTGPISKKAKLTLYLGIQHTCPSELTVRVNGSACHYADFGQGSDLVMKNPTIPPHTVIAYQVDRSDFDPLKQTVTITGDPIAKIFYLELKIAEP